MMCHLYTASRHANSSSTWLFFIHGRFILSKFFEYFFFYEKILTNWTIKIFIFCPFKTIKRIFKISQIQTDLMPHDLQQKLSDILHTENLFNVQLFLILIFRLCIMSFLFVSNAVKSMGSRVILPCFISKSASVLKWQHKSSGQLMSIMIHCNEVWHWKMYAESKGTIKWLHVWLSAVSLHLIKWFSQEHEKRK